MSNLNFLHSGGNKVTLSSPDSNPSSDVTFKLPLTGVQGNKSGFLKTDEIVRCTCFCKFSTWKICKLCCCC